MDLLIKLVSYFSKSKQSHQTRPKHTSLCQEIIKSNLHKFKEFKPTSLESTQKGKKDRPQER